VLDREDLIDDRRVDVAVSGRGAILSITSILWTVRTTPELPLTAAERTRMEALPRGLGSTLREVGEVSDCARRRVRDR
jgi:hypothetical protein